MNLRPALRAALLAGVLASTPLAAVPRWSALGPYGGAVDALAVDPADPRTLYASAGVNGTFKTVDGGATWSLIHPGPASGNLAVDPSRHTTSDRTARPRRFRACHSQPARTTIPGSNSAD